MYLNNANKKYIFISTIYSQVINSYSHINKQR